MFTNTPENGMKKGEEVIKRFRNKTKWSKVHCNVLKRYHQLVSYRNLEPNKILYDHSHPILSRHNNYVLLYTKIYFAIILKKDIPNADLTT